MLVCVALLAACEPEADMSVAPATPVSARATPTRSRVAVDGAIDVPAGTVTTARGVVRVEAFALDRAPVTVAAFRAFVAATDHSTAAERAGGSVLELSSGAWRVVPGATWERPLGAESPLAEDEHPVTQVALADAAAFCAWRGARLPTEDEWEHAARNARDARTTYPWGDDAAPGGAWRLNAWQGALPNANTLADGHLFTSAVGAFPPTELGFVDLVGNVWQWTTSAFDRERAATSEAGSQHDEATDVAPRALRGGSFLCEPSVCHGYRIDARQAAEPSSAWMHVGFRCAR